MEFDKKVEKSKGILKEAVEKYGINKIAIAWTGGKDSTILLSMIREIYGKIPTPVIFVDTTVKFKETYKFRDEIVKRWKINLIIARNDEALKTIEIAKNREECCHLLKTEALNQAIEREGLKAIISGIRWDEQKARKNEEYISPRENHDRIHPILHFTEEDVWTLIKTRNLPYHPLYDKGYRSIGCEPCTKPSLKNGAERSGRSQDKENIMRRLRDLGYF